MKTTFHGRKPQNISSGISQHLLIRFCSNIKANLTKTKQHKMMIMIDDDDDFMKDDH